jgi:hypothetical protein
MPERLKATFTPLLILYHRHPMLNQIGRQGG